eukprot:1044091-Pelagomonas_calceolata.AAC.6
MPLGTLPLSVCVPPLSGAGKAAAEIREGEEWKEAAGLMACELAREVRVVDGWAPLTALWGWGGGGRGQESARSMAAIAVFTESRLLLKRLRCVVLPLPASAEAWPVFAEGEVLGWVGTSLAAVAAVGMEHRLDWGVLAVVPVRAPVPLREEGRAAVAAAMLLVWVWVGRGGLPAVFADLALAVVLLLLLVCIVPSVLPRAEVVRGV